MMKMALWKKVVAGVVACLVAFAVAVAAQPSEFRISRSATMAAAPAVVFEHVNDFQKWPAWSPWEKMDPAMTRTMGTPSAGMGATYGWAGNDQVGEGRMTITESRPAELVRIKLEFLKPFQATNQTEFAFVPEGSGTEVTWTMTGRRNFMFKAVGLFMSMDKMVGGDFERGLANMKAAVEAATPPSLPRGS